MNMTYSESAAGLTISRSRALQELANHGVFHPQDVYQFLTDMGDRPDYDAEDVLVWLGY